MFQVLSLVARRNVQNFPFFSISHMNKSAHGRVTFAICNVKCAAVHLILSPNKFAFFLVIVDVDFTLWTLVKHKKNEEISASDFKSNLAHFYLQF